MLHSVTRHTTCCIQSHDMLHSVTRHTTCCIQSHDTRHRNTQRTRTHIHFQLLLQKIDFFFISHLYFQFLQTVSNMTDSTCSICCDAFNASNRKPILCPFGSCARHACRTCYETFLCGDDVSVPKCMFCNTAFTHSHIHKLGLTKTFLAGPFARHQEDVLFAQELAMLPHAQAAVAHDRLVHNIDLQLRDVHAQIKILNAIKHNLIATKNQLRRQVAILLLSTFFSLPPFFYFMCGIKKTHFFSNCMNTLV